MIRTIVPSNRRAEDRAASGVALLSLVLIMVCTLPAFAVVEIEYWGMWGGRHLGYEQEVIDAFNEMYADQYRVIGYENIDVHEQLPVVVAAGVAPGVVKIDRFRAASYANAGLIESLQPFAERDQFERDAFYPATIEEGIFEGELYAVPWDTDTRALYYNVDMFAEAGLDSNAVPRTWEDITEASRRFERLSPDGRLAQAGFLADKGNWGTIGWMFSAGIELLDETGRVVTWNTPEAERAVEWLILQRQRYGAEGDALWDSRGFENGALAMVLNVSGYAGNLETNAPDINYGLAMPPRPAGLEDTPVSWSGGFAFAMPFGLQPEEQEAAWAFIHLWSSHWAQITMASTARYIPSRQSAATHPDLWERFPELEFFSQLMPYSRWRPVSPFGDQIWNFVHEIGNEINESSPRSPGIILEDTARRAQAVLDEGWSK